MIEINARELAYIIGHTYLEQLLKGEIRIILVKNPERAHGVVMLGVTTPERVKEVDEIIKKKFTNYPESFEGSDL